jgi:hypothetical protein
MFNFKRTYKPPFKYEIPHYTKDFIKQRFFFSRWIKYFKRYLFITLNSQKNLELCAILPAHKDILWINISAPSLGDSLMDLSSRVMLEGRNVDLFTTGNVASLFLNDRIFNNVYSSSSIEMAAKKNYSLVIIDSFSSRSIEVKCKIAPKVDFVGMYGYFNGPEVNRVLFSFHQMNKLLDYQKSEKEINLSARTLISISKVDKEIINKINLPESFIVIVLGGEWKYRTYNNWNKVIDNILKKNNHLNIVLLGSENANLIAKKIFAQFTNNNIFNYVAKYSFNQTAEIISRANVVICCDGGLMHATNSFNKIVIPIFARLTPEMQLTDCINAFPLFDDLDVNNIDDEDVSAKYYEATNFADNHLQDG